MSWFSFYAIDDLSLSRKKEIWPFWLVCSQSIFVFGEKNPLFLALKYFEGNMYTARSHAMKLYEVCLFACTSCVCLSELSSSSSSSFTQNILSSIFCCCCCWFLCCFHLCLVLFICPECTTLAFLFAQIISLRYQHFHSSFSSFILYPVWWNEKSKFYIIFFFFSVSLVLWLVGIIFSHSICFADLVWI